MLLASPGPFRRNNGWSTDATCVLWALSPTTGLPMLLVVQRPAGLLMLLASAGLFRPALLLMLLASSGPFRPAGLLKPDATCVL
jgi:hypothetical protein